ncbi:MAG: hypothetical protein Q8L27_02790 [archaeon]|nr:hypothetical protein [archaeon]
MDWKECKDNELVKSAKIDENLINSLIKSSKNKMASANSMKLNEITASSKIILLYDSLREILEALALKNGFKVYNHECYCSFLREICNEEKFSREFNEFRKLKNRINYYAEDVSTKDALVLIEDIINLRKEVFNKYF